ncbi:NAD(P)/FAD-dependent oxidoreductase [Hoyosella sp. G463]|uniref:Pyridine nucleotide-disulfide oxidoreductase domain-containing protein 2 n=1 Tax=Lolliginicoccus lacisalsi TaxID=2742202 RepID=A0A927JC30_9ACTN|nr:NAD(P)/FAD-dependent oxidoreductase [Lolliginicoccus lacisalsi]MBD8506459.1 NAD(P)/FAD-dependent oxidoreductase [Lolliginicoccus lacisalsi]
MTPVADAVIIGSGPNGLVAANVLADHGWTVQVLEAASEPGGAVRSVLREPGITWDLFSSFYPFARATPALPSLGLEEFGLRWRHAPSPLAHIYGEDLEDAICIEPTSAGTAAAIARTSMRDARTWLELCDEWHVIGPHLLRMMFNPFPPVRGAAGLLRALGAAGALRFARFLALPVQRMEAELFDSEPARALLRGNAMHADVPPDAPVSGVIGYVMSMLAQEHGFPTPEGGAGALTSALARRLEEAGGRITCDSPVDQIIVENGRATGVTTAIGKVFRARRAVIADTSAPALYEELLPREVVPEQVARDIRAFAWDPPVVKVNYAIRGAIPWTAASAHHAGTVHLGSINDSTAPLVIVGQMSVADPSRSSRGTTSAWAYAKAPAQSSEEEQQQFAEWITSVIEAHAPGFGAQLIGSEVQTGKDMERENPNLRGGAVNAGTFELHQQYIFRPIPGLADNHTPVAGLYLGSASAHPGGGVHGMCGWNAAHAALGARWPRQRIRAAINRKLMS